MQRQVIGRAFRLSTALVMVVSLACALLHVSTPAAARTAQGPLLRLHRGTFDAASQANVQASAELAAVTPDVAVIQFSGPIRTADRDALEATGVSILEYIPDFAYLVEGSEAQLAAAAKLPAVYAQVPLLAADKLAPQLLAALTGMDTFQAAEVSVQPWPGQGPQLTDALLQLGVDPNQPLTARQLRALAATPAVRWIEPRFAPRLFNDRAREIMRVDSAWVDRGLYGAGQIVAIADSGLDTGDPATLSRDFAGRVVATHLLSPTGTPADEFGHGTHVAGSLAGAGVESGADPASRRYAGSFAGVAPKASLVIQAFEVDANGTITGLGDNPYPILAQAYASGARIHSDSWGGPTGALILDPEGYFGGYTTPSRQMDAFIWDQPDLTVFVAAGNSGNDGDYFGAGCFPNGDGWVDEDSLMAPGTAKNVITVGASESVRLEGNLTALRWSQFSAFPLISCFARDPVANDLLANNANGMAAFSSRGPTDDGRIKPDVVAPGTAIVSNRSSHPNAGDLWGKYTPNSKYTIAGGTSMATPLAAGGGVLVREWLERQGVPSPSAAAIKAVLLSTTANMAPGQYVVGGRQEIPAARPNNVAGWGRVDLGFLATPAPYGLWIDDHREGLTTGQTIAYQHGASRPLVVTDSSQPLRIMLIWSDPPASLSAARQLVNDLDLVVIGPDGRQFWGNRASGGDRVNNVEGVIIEAPVPGAYRVEVRAYNVAIEAQPYALVAAGPLAPGPLRLEASAGLEVAEGQSATLTREALRVSGAIPEQLTFTLAREPQHGELTLNGGRLSAAQTFSQADIDAGRLRYAHDGGETTSDGFDFSVGDGLGHTLPAGTFAITVIPVNDAPLVIDDSAETSVGQSVSVDVLANDLDPEGDPLTITSVSTPSVGIATINSSGVTFTPPPDFVGTATMHYTVEDGKGGSAIGQLQIRATAEPSPPGNAPRLRVLLPLVLN